jgi:hypothetical protein
MLETRVQPTYSLDIYIIFISLFTADVFVTYVRDRVLPTYSLDIYIIFISLITGDVFVTYVREKGTTNLFLDIYIIFISLFTADVFVTYVRDKGSSNLFPGHLFNNNLSAFTTHPVLKTLEIKQRCFSVYEHYTDTQREHIASVIA